MGEGKSGDLSVGVAWEIAPMRCSPSQAEGQKLVPQKCLCESGDESLLERIM